MFAYVFFAYIALDFVCGMVDVLSMGFGYVVYVGAVVGLGLHGLDAFLGLAMALGVGDEEFPGLGYGYMSRGIYIIAKYIQMSHFLPIILA